MGAIHRTEFGEDDLESLLDRDLAAPEPEPDLTVGRPLAGSPQNLAILRREIGLPPRVLARQPAQIGQHAVQELRAQLAPSPGRVADRRDKLIGRSRLEEIA